MDVHLTTKVLRLVLNLVTTCWHCRNGRHGWRFSWGNDLYLQGWGSVSHQLLERPGRPSSRGLRNGVNALPLCSIILQKTMREFNSEGLKGRGGATSECIVHRCQVRLQKFQSGRRKNIGARLPDDLCKQERLTSLSDFFGKAHSKQTSPSIGLALQLL